MERRWTKGPWRVGNDDDCNDGWMREITCHQRLETVRKIIREVGPTVGYE